jgi:hypothetical protein
MIPTTGVRYNLSKGLATRAPHSYDTPKPDYSSSFTPKNSPLFSFAEYPVACCGELHCLRRSPLIRWVDGAQLLGIRQLKILIRAM